MSDALERFAISMNQARPIFSAGKITELAQILLKGPKKEAAAPVSDASAPPAIAGKDTTDELFSSTQPSDTHKSSSTDDPLAQFQTSANRQSGSTRPDTGEDDREVSFQSLSEPAQESELLGDVENTPTGTGSKPTSSTPKKAGMFGMTSKQLLVLGAILFVWICGMASFAIYIYFNL
jgi:hypothetical protein